MSMDRMSQKPVPTPRPTPGGRVVGRPQFLAEADCRELLTRLARFSTGGGYTSVSIMSLWTGNVRWARNQLSTAGEVANNWITVRRSIHGATATVELNDTTDVALVAAARRAERLVQQDLERPNSELLPRLPAESALRPALFSKATYQLDAEHRAAAAVALTQQAQAAGLLSAGYIEVAAVGAGTFDTFGRVRYDAYTQAQYSVTVRDPKGQGSGWAGMDHSDWAKLDGTALTQRALEKCVQSRNPVAIEPGRYTTILEPQAVADFLGPFVRGSAGESGSFDRSVNEDAQSPGPFFKERRQGIAYAKLGEPVIDERLSLSADPMDPDMGFPPFNISLGRYTLDDFVRPVYHPVTWIEHGVLTNLAYERFDDNIHAGPGRDENQGLPNSGAFRLRGSGTETAIEEMIATTKRGLLVTRFDQVLLLSFPSQLYRGFTRDGLWLIEQGKISKSVKNLAFTESVLFALNNVEQIGRPQRVFHPTVAPLFQIPQPAVVPALKIRDFSFTALVDAV